MIRATIDPEGFQAPKLGLLLLQGLVITLFCVFVLRFWYLQIHQGERFVLLAQENSLRQERIFASRGLIRDINGVLLADNRPAFALGLIREDCYDIAATLAQVSAWMDIPLDSLVKKFREDRRKVKAFEPIWLVPDISFEQMARIQTQLLLWPGLEIIINSRRTYPQGSVFAHILGYVAEANKEEIDTDPQLSLGDSVGRQGIEAVLEKRLRGKKGLHSLEVDTRGRVLNKRLTSLPVHGTDIRLTLDAVLQQDIVRLLGEQTGSVVVMDPHSGRLHALVTTPAYDNNLFISGFSHTQWASLEDNFRAPLLNRGIQSVYPPASVWKLMMAGLFLDEGILPTDRVRCVGETRLGVQTFRCWKKNGHGSVNMMKAIVDSCDIYFYLKGEEVGIDRIEKFALASGFGKLTGIDLRYEKSGLVPSRAWKERRTGEKWYRGETYNIAIGQGYTLITPLQLATFVSALVSDGKLYKPQIFNDMPAEERGNIPISAKHRAFLLKAMQSTVEDGTARVLKRKGLVIGGKTGTAQVVKLKMDGDRRLKTEEMEYFERDHAWIASFIKYKGEDVVVIVMVEHGGGGGAVAGPIARDVMTAFLRGRDATSAQLKIAEQNVTTQNSGQGSVQSSGQGSVL